MAIEIERKYLLKNDSWRELSSKSTLMCQAYFTGSDRASIRIRIEGALAYINIKSNTLNITRSEYEYAIPLADANELLENLCDSTRITKTRYIVYHNSKKWEIDEFEGDNKGLIVAEIELDSEHERIEIPDFIATEVSDDVRYYNVNLVTHPYNKW